MMQNGDHTLSPIAFWQQVYIAAIRAGEDSYYAKIRADNAVKEMFDFDIDNFRMQDESV